MLISLIAFTAIYGALAVVEFGLIMKAAQKGPADADRGRRRDRRASSTKRRSTRKDASWICPYLWFWIVGFLFVGYFVLDGFDFGVGMSLPFLGKDDIDRRLLINTIGPVWDLNETWVIVAGACLFAAFPEWYATLFSGFYLPLLLILLALILRGVSFEYRHQREQRAWKRALRPDDRRRLGRARVPLGRRLRATSCRACRSTRTTTSPARFFDLLNPYALLGGLTTLLLFFTHGVVFVALKTDGDMRERARRLGDPGRARHDRRRAPRSCVAMAIAHGHPRSRWCSRSSPRVALIARRALRTLRGREGRAFALHGRDHRRWPCSACSPRCSRT